MNPMVKITVPFLFFLVSLSCSPRNESAPISSSANPAVSQPGKPKADVYAFRLKSDSPDKAAAIKAPDGTTIIEGRINGLIVQKQDTSKPTQKVYTAWYYLVKGDEIGAIDETGVHKTVPVTDDLGVRQEGKPLDDIEILQIAAKMPEDKSSGKRTKVGGMVLRSRNTSMMGPIVNPLPILGEFKTDPKTGKGQLIPAIEVTTDNGVVTIPLEKLVKFKSNSAVP